jgi:hypothetical protein
MPCRHGTTSITVGVGQKTAAIVMPLVGSGV